MEGLEAKYGSSKQDEPQTPNQQHFISSTIKKTKRRNDRLQIDFELSTLSLDQHYEHYLAFKNLLADTIGVEEGQRITFEDLVQATMQRIGDYTSEELVGMALYHFDLLLLHLRDLSQPTLRSMVKNLLLLLNHSIDSRNGQAVFVCLELVELVSEAVETDLIVHELMPFFDQLENLDLIGKLTSSLLCLKDAGHKALLSLLDEVKGEKRLAMMQACLYHPVILRGSVIPMLLEDAANKMLSTSRRTQAMLLLSRTGSLLEKPNWVALFAAGIRHASLDLDLAAQCLVSAGKLGSKEFISLLKTDGLSDKTRAVLCRNLQSYSRELTVPSFQISIVRESQDSARDSPGAFKWSLLSGGQKLEEGSSLRECEQVALQLSIEEAESLLRRFLMMPAVSAQKADFYFDSRAKYLFCYNVLYLGAVKKNEKKVPKSIVCLLLDNLDYLDPAVKEAALSSLSRIGVEWSQLVLPKVEQ